METKQRAKFRRKRGCLEWAQVRPSPLWTTAGKGGRKRMGRMGNGPEKHCRQAGEGTGRDQSAFQVAWVKERQVKWNTSGTLRHGVPTAQSHRFPRDLPSSERNDKSMATAIYLTAFLTTEKRNSGQVCGYVFIRAVKWLRWQDEIHAI